MAHKWHPIEDLGNSFNESVHDELRHLAEVWHEQKSDMDQEQLQIFNDKLNREWAIETGQIEGVYDIDRGTTETLIERGISEQWIPHTVQNPGKTLAMLLDHQNVVDGLFDFVKGERELSVSYIKMLHSALTQNQDIAISVDQFGKKRDIPLLHGEFKKRSNDPTTPSGEIHHYCPPEQTASEMDNLIAMYLAHSERKIPPLAAAAWLHHRFVQIHPFQDGNGRVARCLASVIFIKAEWFPLVINRGDVREKYIDALQTADGGDLSPLIDLFASAQRKFFDSAARIAGGIAHDYEVDALVKSTVQKIKTHQTVMEKYKPAHDIADKLAMLTRHHLQDISTRIKTESNAAIQASVYSTTNDDFTDRSQGQHLASRGIDYHLNTDAYAAYHRLNIESGSDFNIVIVFHGVGMEYRGTIACTAFCFIKFQVVQLADKIFPINYTDSLEETQKRFEPWLQKVLATGLQKWQGNL